MSKWFERSKPKRILKPKKCNKCNLTMEDCECEFNIDEADDSPQIGESYATIGQYSAATS